MKQTLACLILISLHLTSFNMMAQNTTDGWFEFRPGDIKEKAVTDMSAWIEKPAGKHGTLGYKGKDFVFEDGTKIKFWGVNIASHSPFPDQQLAHDWTRILSRFGINSVRFHKFTWDATDGKHSTVITPEHWQNLDYFSNALRNEGIYYGWSHIYGHRVMPADSARLLAYSEVKNTRFPWSHLNSTTASLVNFAEDLQALNIELTVNMLNHVNPHTGKKYAEDPALAFVELQNEDNIFWGAIEETLKQTPSYRKLLCEKFSDWLLKKYKSESALSKSWQGKGLTIGESLPKKNIYPNPSHGYFSHEYDLALKENRPVPPHVADRATFLYEEQMKFYKKFIQAIRQTGFKGVIIGSCWQAGSGITHFYNLHTDYVAGPIDRHNYFGGGSGHSLRPGKFDNTAMVSTPGSGLLSTGFQQAIDRPFQLSEWMSLIPSEWVAEAAPLIAAYGMGLQGWDGSFSFAMDNPAYTNTIQQGNGIYNVPSPTHLAFYPALAAMIYRNDVSEGDVVANRNVNLSDLEKGKLTIREKTSQQYDLKSFESDVPVEYLALGRVTFSFDTVVHISTPDISKYWNKEKKTIRSTTGQLEWDYSARGHLTINTAGTQGVVGFASGKRINLQDVTITTSTNFAVVLVSSLEKDQPVSGAASVLVTAIARARNTGMQFEEDNVLSNIGSAPILLEPVKLNLSFKSRRVRKIRVLNHTGSDTGEVVPLTDKEISLDASKHKTIYYQIEFE